MSWTVDCWMRCFRSKNRSRKIDAGSESPIGVEEFLNYVTPQCKKDIMKNRKLKGLFKECLGNCSQAKVIIAELQRCVQGAAGTAECFQKVKSMYEQQEKTLEKLELRKKKLNRVPAWRKVSTVTLRSTFVVALISSIVAAALAAPPVAAALSAAAAIPLEPMRKWVDRVWKKYEKVLEGQKVSVTCMEEATDLAMKDLADLIERLENSA